MAFEGKSLDEVDANDIFALQANEVSEGKTLDYKRSLPGDTADEKKEFLADVSSFANAAGGHLIFGIEEAEGIPTAIPGVGPINVDQEKQRLENIMRDGLAPRIPGLRITAIEVATDQLGL